MKSLSWNNVREIVGDEDNIDSGYNNYDNKNNDYDDTDYGND